MSGSNAPSPWSSLLQVYTHFKKNKTCFSFKWICSQKTKRRSHEGNCVNNTCSQHPALGLDPEGLLSEKHLSQHCVGSFALQISSHKECICSLSEPLLKEQHFGQDWKGRGVPRSSICLWFPATLLQPIATCSTEAWQSFGVHTNHTVLLELKNATPVPFPCSTEALDKGGMEPQACPVIRCAASPCTLCAVLTATAWKGHRTIKECPKKGYKGVVWRGRCAGSSWGPLFCSTQRRGGWGEAPWQPYCSLIAAYSALWRIYSSSWQPYSSSQGATIALSLCTTSASLPFVLTVPRCEGQQALSCMSTLPHETSEVL